MPEEHTQTLSDDKWHNKAYETAHLDGLHLIGAEPSLRTRTDNFVSIEHQIQGSMRGAPAFQRVYGCISRLQAYKQEGVSRYVLQRKNGVLLTMFCLKAVIANKRDPDRLEELPAQGVGKFKHCKHTKGCQYDFFQLDGLQGGVLFE